MATPIPFGKRPGFNESSKGEIARQVKRMQELANTTSGGKTGTGAARRFLQQAISQLRGRLPNLTSPSLPSLATLGTNALPVAAAGVGIYGGNALAKSAGTKGASRMSLLGGDAPVYQTPFNNVTEEEVKADSGYTSTDRLMGKPSRGSLSTSQTQTTSGVVNAFGQSFDMSNPKQKAAYEKLQEQELVRQRERGGGFSDIRGGDGLRSDGSRIVPQTTRVIPTGGVQKGTDMSGANALLQKMGIDTVQYGQFESIHLPGEQETAGKPQKTDVDAQLTGQTPAQYLDSRQSTTNLEELPTKETDLVESGEIQASNPAQLGTRERYNQEFLLDRGDKTGEFSESMAGLRAAETSKGLLYASGSYWQEDGKGGFTKIDKATAKRIKRGDTHAQQFATDRIKETQQNLQTDTGKKTYENTDLDASMPTPELVKTFGDMAGDASPSTGDKAYSSTSINARMRIPSQTTYGNIEFAGVMPKAADMPSQQELSPIDTGDVGMSERMKTLREKMENGDFNRFLK